MTESSFSIKEFLDIRDLIYKFIVDDDSVAFYIFHDDIPEPETFDDLLKFSKKELEDRIFNDYNN